MYSPTDIFNLCVELSEGRPISDPARCQTSTSNLEGSQGSGTVSLNRHGSNRKSGARFNRHRSSRNLTESDQKFSKLGLQMAMREFHGHSFLSEECIDVIFESLDTDKDGWIDQREFLSCITMVNEGDDEDDFLEDFSGFSGHESNNANEDEDVEAAGNKPVTMGRRTSWLSGDKEEMEAPDLKPKKKRVSILSKLSNRSGISSAASNSTTARSRTVAEQRQLFGTGKKQAGGVGDESKDFVRNSREIIKTWQMLYCGGSAPVVNNLKNIHDEYGIDLKIEKFDW